MIYNLIEEHCCNRDVLEALFEEDHFSFHEDALWDFKANSPATAATKNQNPDHEAEVCDIAKDVVAMHNTFGGYIVFGVDDKSRQIIGAPDPLDVDSLSGRIRSDCGEAIDFSFEILNFEEKKGGLATCSAPQQQYSTFSAQRCKAI